MGSFEVNSSTPLMIQWELQIEEVVITINIPSAGSDTVSCIGLDGTEVTALSLSELDNNSLASFRRLLAENLNVRETMLRLILSDGSVVANTDDARNLRTL